MKILIITCMALFKTLQPFAQDSTEYFIKNLGWNTFELQRLYVTKLVLSSEAEKVIANNSEQTIKKLLANLCDTSKSAVIHIMLSRMIQPANSELSAKYMPETGPPIAFIEYSCNGLIWKFIAAAKKYSISKKNVAQVRKYWEKIISEKWPQEKK